MNLYIRYFDEECLVKSVEEAYDFLSTIPDILLDGALKDNLKAYAESSIPYPKRYKVRPRVYFIVIKTDASTLENFKENKSKTEAEDVSVSEITEQKKDSVINRLMEKMPGWYEGGIIFKRVVSISGTNKFQYKDTRFRALMKADSGIDCYNRIIEHLKSRQEVDLRSQFPSAKGKNFFFEYLGDQRPEMK